MKIFAGTDCRALRVQKGKKNLTWVQILKKDRDLEVHTTERLKTIHAVADSLRDRDKFDLVIVQVGHYEHHCSWIPRIWEIIMPDFDPKSLVESGSLYHYKKKNQKLYWYFDYPLVEKSMSYIKSRAKHVLIIGVHSWLKGGNKPMWSTYGHHEMGLKLNDVYSSFGMDYLHMPMHYSWVKNNCYDTFHYNGKGQKFIAGYVSRYIKRLGQTIGDRI